MARVELTGVHKRFGEIEVLRDVTLDLADGAFVAFVGPSGCGKTTLLRCIAGLEQTDEGAIRFDGRDVTDVAPARRGAAMVFQSYALYPHKTVFENMAFGLRMARRPRAEIEDRVRTAARTLQIDELLDRKPRALSGGQRQRVAIGRAIVREPGVFLFDEPLSNLDASLRLQMRLEIARLHREIAATMIYVTHDQVEAMTLAETIVVLRDGRVEQAGSPRELYLSPASRFVAGFLGSPQMNFIPVRPAADGSGKPRVVLSSGRSMALTSRADGGQAEDGLTLGVRPESLRLDGGGPVTLWGTICHTEYLGAMAYVHLDVSETDPPVRLVAGAPPHATAVLGDQVPISFSPEDCHLFATDGTAVR